MMGLKEGWYIKLINENLLINTSTQAKIIHENLRRIDKKQNAR